MQRIGGDKLDYCHLDLEKLRELKALGGEDANIFLVELVETFIKDSAGRLSNMEKCFAADDLAGASRYAHAMKSSSMLLGAVCFSERNRLAEHAGFEHNKEVFSEQLAIIRHEYPEITAQLELLMERNFIDL